MRGQRHAPAALYPRERPGTHCTGGWVDPRAGLDRCGKSLPHRDSIPWPSSPVAQSLYWLSYRAHAGCRSIFIICKKISVKYWHVKIKYAQDYSTVPYLTRGPGSSVDIVNDYGLDGPGSNPGGDEIFRPSRPALGPTQPPVKWVPNVSRG